MRNGTWNTGNARKPNWKNTNRKINTIIHNNNNDNNNAKNGIQQTTNKTDKKDVSESPKN